MNERIQKLKDQCWVEKRWDNDMWIEKHIDQEKFAELIVRECAKEAFEFWCNQLDCNEDSAQSHIKKHFGVE